MSCLFVVRWLVVGCWLSLVACCLCGCVVGRGVVVVPAPQGASKGLP